MGSPERSRSYAKRDIEDGLDMKNNRDRDDEEWEGNDNRKHRSSKSRKPSNGDETEGLDGSRRRRSSGDGNESRKRSGGSSRADSDEDEYDTRKDLRSKQMKKKQEESSLEQLSSWYQDGDVDNRKDGGDKSGSRGHSRADESTRRKTTSKFSEHDSSRSGNKGKDERSHYGESEKTLDKDSMYSERRESGQEKVDDSSDTRRNSRRRWDESDALRKVEENHHERVDLRCGKVSDTKYESSKERSGSARRESSESKNRGLDSNSKKGVKSSNREERRVDAEKSKSKGRSEALEEENRGSPIHHEDKSGRDKNEKSRHQRICSGWDVGEGCERSSNKDNDGNTRIKRSNRSRTPEKSRRHHPESEHFEVDFERSNDVKWKEIEKDSNRDERSKARDDSWSDRNGDWESSKENWKRRQPSSNDKEFKDDIFYDRGREWELPRQGHDWNDHERPCGRSGNRKDGSRSEAVKTSSNFGISNKNYDVIEIQTKSLDYGRAESGPNFSQRTEVSHQSDIQLAPTEQEWACMHEDRAKRTDMYGSGHSGEDSRDKYVEDGRDTNSWRDDIDYYGGKGRGQKGALPGRNAGSASSSRPPYGTHEAGPFGRGPPQGLKGSRAGAGRGGRGRPTGRDNQQMGVPLPIMGSHFGPLGMPPPGSMQPLTHAPGPPIFIPPFPTPVVWPGPREVDMNMLGVPPSLSPVPPGPSGPRFPPNIGTPANPSMYFNQAGPGGGGPPSISGPGFSAAGPIVRGTPPDKSSGGWAPPRTVGITGKAPSRGEQNDYSQNFVDTGMRPQNFIRELELTNVVEDYPKLRELIQKKDEIVSKSATAPMYCKCDLREFELSPEFFGTKFDVILVDPPWEEYVHRAPGVADHVEYWTFEEILNLKIEAIADTPSFIFLWVGDGVGLEQGRQCLKKWGFRRCEDICWVKTNKSNATPGLRHGHTLFQHSKEHCLMGIKGTVRRSTDGHIIHANIDTDVIIAEEPPYGTTRKPEDMYRIIEHFVLGRRRLELFGEDHNIRAGWLTIGNGISLSNFNKEAYIRNFADTDGKVWQGGGGRNPPPEASHLVVTTPEIEALRPKSPMKNHQQQQSTSISLTPINSSSRRATGNSPQNPGGLGLNLEASSSNPSTPVPWASPTEGFRGRDISNMPSEDKYFDMYGFTGQANGDYPDFESQRPLNLL